MVYDENFYCATEEERASWMQTIEDVAGARHFEDYYDVCEKIGEGRFAEVYRVAAGRRSHVVHRQEVPPRVRREGDQQGEAVGGGAGARA